MGDDLYKRFKHALLKGRDSGGSNRVIRGGGWNNNARNLRCSNRNNNDPSKRNNNLGFRLCQHNF
ncbi:MAG: SUMF1/EgtB/PvdO family nonheme iron enzyme [bacterium]|nr:SUMF1/EgtB/PvdO family nonheme iron enzyme [bacterium]